MLSSERIGIAILVIAVGLFFGAVRAASLEDVGTDPPSIEDRVDFDEDLEDDIDDDFEDRDGVEELDDFEDRDDAEGRDDRGDEDEG